MFARPRQRQRFRGIDDRYILGNLAYGVDLRTNTLPAGLTFSRPSAKTGFVNGQLVQYASGVPAISATDGYFGENEQRTNYIPNGNMAGAVAGVIGSGGVLPTGWQTIFSITGLTTTMVGSGTDENGWPYAEIRFAGTPASSGQVNWALTPATAIAALVNQLWTLSLYTKLVSGSLSNVSFFTLQLVERDSGGGLLTTCEVNFTPSSSMQRVVSSRQLINASTAYLSQKIIFGVTSGMPIDFTLRFYAAQQEQGEGATSYIPTTTAAATRAADVLYATPVINTTEGMLVVEYVENIDFAATYYTSPAKLSDGTSNNLIMPRNNPGSTVHNLYTKSGGAVVSNNSIGNLGVGVVSKIGIGYSASGISGCLNGNSVLSMAVAAPLGLNRIDIATGNFCGNIRRIRYYNTRNDAKMQALTA